MVHKDGGLVEEIIETDEDANRLLAHAHIHSIELLDKPEEYLDERKAMDGPIITKRSYKRK